MPPEARDRSRRLGTSSGCKIFEFELTIDAVVCRVIVCGKISRVHCSHLTCDIWCNLSCTLTVAIVLQLAGSLLMANDIKLTWSTKVRL